MLGRVAGFASIVIAVAIAIAIIPNLSLARVPAQPALPDLKVSVGDIAEPAFVNEDLIYSATVKNNGGAAATNVVLKDTLPIEVVYKSFASAKANCTAVAGTLNVTPTIVTCTIGTIAVNETVGIDLVVTPKVVTTIRNKAELTLTEVDIFDGDNVAETATVISEAADMTITITDNSPFTVGNQGKYTLTAKNNGDAPAGAPIKIVASIPSGVTYTGFTSVSPGWSCTPNGVSTVVCTNQTTLQPDQSSVVELLVNVLPAAVPSVTLSATVSSTTGDPKPFNNTASITSPVPSADLAIAKTDNGPFKVGENGVYTLKVTNNGPSATSGTLTVVDTLPNGLAFVSSSGAGWTCAAQTGNKVQCTSNVVLQPNTFTSFTLTVSVSQAAVPNVTNTATVTSGVPDNVPDNNTTTIVTQVPQADLAIVKSAVGNFVAGAQAQYSMLVTNNGPSAAAGPITIADTLPPGLTFVSASGSGWTCAVPTSALIRSASGVVNCSFAAGLDAKASTTIVFTVFVAGDAPSSVTNTVTVSGPTPDPNPNNNTSQVTTPVSPPPPGTPTPTATTPPATATPTSGPATATPTSGPGTATPTPTQPTGGPQGGPTVTPTVPLVSKPQGDPNGPIGRPQGDTDDNGNSKDNRQDKDKKETDEQRQQRERTNKGNKDDVYTEGDVLEIDCSANNVPTVYIGTRDGRQQIRLYYDTKLQCTSILVGDYLEVDGVKQHELLFDAENITIKRGGKKRS
ncbi:MAG: hypothetical protein U0821_26665 [Chloroflexota bacterium]